MINANPTITSFPLYSPQDPIRGFSTDTCFSWLHDKNIEFKANIRGMVNYEYNRLLIEKNLELNLIPGGEDLEKLGMDKTTDIVRPDLYFHACKNAMSDRTNTPFTGLNLSTGTFFDLLSHENSKYNANVRGCINDWYNQLIRNDWLFRDEKTIPGHNLEQVSLDDRTPLRIDLYAKAYEEVMASYEKCVTYSHFGPFEMEEPSIPLEIEFASQCFVDVDINHNCNFTDYLSPNETPKGVKPHLELAPAGIHIAAGTERLFFGLIHSDEKKCKGIVGRDINTRVKAYIDFNTLLLRICATSKEYNQLSTDLEVVDGEKSLASRIAIISNKLESCSLPDKVKRYYQEHLIDFGTIYLREPKSWRTNDDFNDCHYHLNDDHFLKLQRFAKAGNIISMVGPIGDLTSLNFRKIAVVDVSNILDYCIIDLKGNGIFNPRVITTSVLSKITDFYSYIHEPLSAKEGAEFDDTLELLATLLDDSRFNVLKHYCSRNDEQYPFNRIRGAIRSKKTLCTMKEHMAENILQAPGLRPFHMVRGIRQLNSLTPEEIESLCKYKETARFLDWLISGWISLDSSVYLAFNKIPGWNEKFETHFSMPCLNLPGLLDKLRKDGLLEKFTADFGEERINNLALKIARK